MIICRITTGPPLANMARNKATGFFEPRLFGVERRFGRNSGEGRAVVIVKVV